jgi:flagellar biosynthesis protein FlhB
MAEQQQDLDRNEPATAFKLEKARRRGSIVRSNEVTFAAILIAAVASLYGLGPQALNDVAELMRRGVMQAGRSELALPSMRGHLQALVMQALAAIASFVFVIWLTALLVAGMQARGVFSTEPLKPDFSRLSPANGFKRVLSLKSLHDSWRTTLKLIVFAVAAVTWGAHHLLEILRMPPAATGMVASGLDLTGSLLTMLAGIVAAFALLDWLINHWEHMRNLRMSKREIKDEHKEREGDPRIKSRLRELRLEWLKRTRQLAKVKSADVLLTNPTHYAVALEYRYGEMPAPMITARGAGEMARRMREEAQRRMVPVVEHPPLARALFATKDAESFVPEEYFEQVARVLRWVYAARGRQPSSRGSR